MALKDWNYEKDAYGDDSWDRKKDGFYYELRIYPIDTPSIHQIYALYLVKFERKGLTAKRLATRTLKKSSSKDELSKFAKQYMRSH